MKKLCQKCQHTLPIESFNKNKSAIDGRQNLCRKCFYQKYKHTVSRWNKKNPGKSSEYYKKWYQENRQKQIRNVMDRIIDRRRSDDWFRAEQVVRQYLHRVYSYGLKYDTRFQKRFGYRVSTLMAKLQPQIDALKKAGVKYCLDHSIPFSYFHKHSPMDIINAVENLNIVPAKDNRAKRNTFASPVSPEYLDRALPHIKKEYLNQIPQLNNLHQ